MMNYNPMGNPYSMYNPHPNLFANTMQQMYGNAIPQPQQQTQQTQQSQNQQNISTQPPIMQPRINSTIIPISNKEEATATPVDLINGTPSFFYNKGKNEIYLKQFDVQNGNAIFKVYSEIQTSDEPITEEKSSLGINPYEQEFKRLNEGIDSLHRMIAQLQEREEQRFFESEPEINVEPVHKPKGKKNA